MRRETCASAPGTPLLMCTDSGRTGGSDDNVGRAQRGKTYSQLHTDGSGWLLEMEIGDITEAQRFRRQHHRTIYHVSINHERRCEERPTGGSDSSKHGNASACS